MVFSYLGAFLKLESSGMSDQVGETAIRSVCFGILPFEIKHDKQGLPGFLDCRK